MSLVYGHVQVENPERLMWKIHFFPWKMPGLKKILFPLFHCSIITSLAHRQPLRNIIQYHLRHWSIQTMKEVSHKKSSDDLMLPSRCFHLQHWIWLTPEVTFLSWVYVFGVIFWMIKSRFWHACCEVVALFNDTQINAGKNFTKSSSTNRNCKKRSILGILEKKYLRRVYAQN